MYKPISSALWGLVLLAASPVMAQSSGATAFTLDATHTFPSFEIRHHGVSTLRGKFNRTQGRVVLDPSGANNLIEVVVDAGSVDTGLDDLNEKLRGGSFFRVASFPEARFEARNIRFVDAKPVVAEGTLTLLGVTRPVTLEIRDYACTVHFLSRRALCGADAHATIRRSEFGMTWGIPLVGDEVKLAIEVEGFRD